MFAKLFTTPSGQYLIQKGESDVDSHMYYQVIHTFDSATTMPALNAVITKTVSYVGSRVGEQNRDLAFDTFNQEMAESAARLGVF